MVLQVRMVLDRPVGLKIRITPVSCTLRAVLGVILVEGMNPLISPPRFPCAKHQATNQGPVENAFETSTVLMSVTAAVPGKLRAPDRTLECVVDGAHFGAMDGTLRSGTLTTSPFGRTGTTRCLAITAVCFDLSICVSGCNQTAPKMIQERAHDPLAPCGGPLLLCDAL
jgi:hypothetical protein